MKIALFLSGIGRRRWQRAKCRRAGTINFSNNSIHGYFDEKILPNDLGSTSKNILFGTLYNMCVDATSDILSGNGLGSYMDNLAAQLFGDGLSSVPTKEKEDCGNETK